ncbi:MAG: carbohydrate binding family 9 domain-containing protein [Bacteroidales bacterium]|nr:carbohydrate binding family 9 domain-containing protein [Bacteroidales bacterium]
MKRIITFVFLYYCIIISYAKGSDSVIFYKAIKINSKIEIDGIIDEVWENIPSIKNFVQRTPFYGKKPLYDTEVKITYDNIAIYVLAFMYDNNPDSIRLQFGERDDKILDADYFYISFDPYNKQNDAYVFGVTASNVQVDWKYSDNSYNGVWQSKTAITYNGWIAEFMIPFSEIKFPANNTTWRFQCQRIIRRNRETSQLALEPLYENNVLKHWAYLTDINNIIPQLTLKFKPYTALGLMYQNNNTDYYFKGGIDITYSLSESYNLSMMLLPDFSQVQSDDKYKNLSAFETVYEEQRPFFKEANEYFNKDNVFYSRRVGKTPSLYYKVESYIDSSATIKKNPSQQQIINAFKIYGRNTNGLALAILNATTSNTYCVYTHNNSTEKILTEPWANYNVFVIDKAFKGGSNFYIINSNFLRNFEYRNSNVISGGINFLTNNNKWLINSNVSNTLLYFPDSKKIQEKPGFSHSFNVSKVSGKVTFGTGYSVMNKYYNANDIGLTLYNNYFNYDSYIGFRQNEPSTNLLSYYLGLSFNNNYYLSTKKLSSSFLSFNYSGNTKNYFSFWGHISTNFFKTRDYYEPRVPGYFFVSGKNISFYNGTSTDYRKPFAIDFSTSLSYSFLYKTNSYFIEISPLIRLSNRLRLRYETNFSYDFNDIGYVFNTDSSVFFGRRDIKTIENTISILYNFSAKTYLKIRTRHNWSIGKYDKIFLLTHTGNLLSQINNFNFIPSDFNFNFNALNADLTLYYEYLPGNFFMFIYKFEIFSDEINDKINGYLDNIQYLSELPFSHTILIKFLWYINSDKFIKKLI